MAREERVLILRTPSGSGCEGPASSVRPICLHPAAPDPDPQVVHGVDATNLQRTFGARRFKAVRFNFPHPGHNRGTREMEGNTWENKAHLCLIQSFLQRSVGRHARDARLAAGGWMPAVGACACARVCVCACRSEGRACAAQRQEGGGSGRTEAGASHRALAIVCERRAAAAARGDEPHVGHLI